MDIGFLKTIFSAVGFATICFVLCCGFGVILEKLDGKTKDKKKPKRTKKKYVTFTKRWFRIILINSVIWVYLSFILAFFDKTQIAEAISVQAIITIIGTFFTYSIKSAYEKKIGKESEEYDYENQLETEINQP
jgi:hypothetical protein